MHTTRGEIPEEQLRKDIITEDVPCGKCVTTSFYSEDGELVRRDIEIQADLASLGMAGLTGEN